MKRPNSTSNVFPIREDAKNGPLSPLGPTGRTRMGFPAVTASTGNDIRRVLDEQAADSDDGRARYRTPITPIDSETIAQTLPSNRPPSPPPPESVKRYSIHPKPPIEEKVTTEYSQRPSDVPPSREPVKPKQRTFKEAFSDLSPTSKLAVIELEMQKDNNDAFLKKYRELKTSRDIVPTLIKSLSIFLNGRVISLPPQFYSKSGNTQWVIVDCTEASLDTSFPMVQVIPLDEINNYNPNPTSVPLRIVFTSNLIQ